MRIAMLCLCGAPPEEKSTIIDVKKVLEDYTWNQFKNRMGTCAKTFLRRRDFVIEVPLNYYHTEDIKQTYVRRDPSSKSSATKDGKERVSELQTEFKNNTDTSQTYKFRFERTRKASINVTFQKGFSLGGKAQFTLGLPGTGSKAGGELNMSLQVTKTEGENFEDTLVMEATGDISVEKKHTYITGVCLKQIEIAYDFTVETMLRMPNNKAPVTIKRRRGGDVVASFFIKNLKDVFETIPSVDIIDETPPEGKIKVYAIKFTTTGIVEGAQLSKQDIILNSQKIDSKDQSTSTVEVPQIVIRPSDLGTISPAQDTKDKPAKSNSLDEIILTSTDKLKDPQTATERRSSFKKLNQMGEDYTSLTVGSPETKILHSPKIPTIIRTSPSTPKSTQSLHGDKEESGQRDKRRAGVRAKSPLRMTDPHSFHGPFPSAVRPKLSKMTSV